MREASLWKSLPDNKVHCRLCSHYCVIADGEYGICGVRANRSGTLMTLVYDRVASLAVDPVEKKPLFHYLPGSLTLSFATMGCNFACSFCQNHALSQPPRNGHEPQGQPVTPDDLVQAAIKEECRSISYTYSEPTIFFELLRDTATAAKQAGLGNIMVSNGFQSHECLKELAPLISAANIDLKAFSVEFYEKECGAKLAPIRDNLKRMVDFGWWLEITTLVIPGKNDSDEELGRIAGFIAEELGTSVPWHVSRFHPDYRMQSTGPTPVATLERAKKLGESAGLRYIYTGNVPGHDAEHTTCPGCSSIALGRSGFRLTTPIPADGQCPECGYQLAGVWN